MNIQIQHTHSHRKTLNKTDTPKTFHVVCVCIHKYNSCNTYSGCDISCVNLYSTVVVLLVVFTHTVVVLLVVFTHTVVVLLVVFTLTHLQWLCY